MSVHVDTRERVTVLTIDRPDVRNAVDIPTLERLHAGIVGAAEESRVIVLRGAGGHFCAGADLGSVEDDEFVARLRDVLLALRDVERPVVAAIEGAALGAGTQLAVACDLRVATADARFGIPAAKLGLMVDQWTVQRLTLLAGHGPARAMLLAAETITGEDAHRLGLVQRVGDVDAALAWADEIAALAPLTIAGHKLSINRCEPELARDDDVNAAFERAWASRDLAEGMTAFRERRTPQFGGT